MRLAVTAYALGWIRAAFAYGALVVLSSGCQSRALEVALCGEDVSSYVTDWSGFLVGIHDFAYVRLLTPDEHSAALVLASCKIARQPLSRVLYPNEWPPESFPDWWDIEVNEEVDYGTLVLNGGAGQGIVYRKTTPRGVVWLIFAASS